MQQASDISGGPSTLPVLLQAGSSHKVTVALLLLPLWALALAHGAFQCPAVLDLAPAPA